MTGRVLIAGIGNEHRRDDGAGPAVARLVAARCPEVCDAGPAVDPLDLLGRWDSAGLAVVVDAVQSGAAPGSITVVDLTPAPAAEPATVPAKPAGTVAAPRRNVTSTHGIDLAGVLRLAQVVGCAPDRVVLVGIEGEEFGPGTGLSPAVARAVPEAAHRVLGIIGGG